MRTRAETDPLSLPGRAYITTPNANEAAVELDLLDNGNNADVQAGDGTYSRYFTQFVATGRYAVKAQVEHPVCVVLPFALHLLLTFSSLSSFWLTHLFRPGLRQVWDDGSSYINNGFITSRRSARRSRSVPLALASLAALEQLGESLLPKRILSPASSLPSLVLSSVRFDYLVVPKNYMSVKLPVSFKTR